MMRKQKKAWHLIGIILVTVIILVFAYLKEFTENRDVKIVAGVISLGAALGWGIKQYLSHFSDRSVSLRVHKYLKRMPIFSILIRTEKQGTEKVELEQNIKRKAKDAFLKHAEDKFSMVDRIVRRSEIFTFDFGLVPEIYPGSELFDQKKDWENYIHENQFQLITGESGFGKSFELIKRAIRFHELMQKKPLEEQIVPVYIELKSLDQKLDRDWIFDYLNGTNKADQKEWLNWLLYKKQIAYFFDGLDEVDERWRSDCYEELISMAGTASVYFSCRTGVFRELINPDVPKTEDSIYSKEQADQLPSRDPFAGLEVSGLIPARIVLPELNEQQILEIIAKQPDKSGEEKSRMVEYLNANRDLFEEKFFTPLTLNLFMKGYEKLAPEEKKYIDENKHDRSILVRLLWKTYEDIVTDKKFPKISEKANMAKAERNKLNEQLDRKIRKIRTYTIWIAKITGGSSFAIERIQPKWLMKLDENKKVVSSSLRLGLYFIVTRVVTAVLLSVAVGCIVATPLAFVANSIMLGFLVTGWAGIYKSLPLTVGKVARAILIIVSSVILVSCAVIYQGFSVPRSPHDMTTDSFSLAEGYGALLLGLVLVLFFNYRIILENKAQQYILPVEKVDIDRGQAVAAGLLWGLTVGLIIGTCALFVKHFLSATTFYNGWLEPSVNELIGWLRGTTSPSYVNDVILFAYGFLIAFFVAFFIVVLIAGRQFKALEAEQQKRTLNYGIKQSLINGASRAGITFTAVAVFYSILLFWFGTDSAFRGLLISFGMALISFLWFGGIEIIHHRILRFSLYMCRITPRDFDGWVKFNQSIGTVLNTGSELKFYHASLAEYYQTYDLQDEKRVIPYKNRKIDLVIFWCLIALFSLLLLEPFLQRFVQKVHWQQPHQVETDLMGIAKVNDSLYLVSKSGIMQVSAHGRVHLGTFVGSSGVTGITRGFLGMKLKSSYNDPKTPQFRHGALLFRRYNRSQAKWSPYDYLSPDMHQTWRKDWQRVDKGDSLEIRTNDADWRNNKGMYKVKIIVCDTCR